MSEARARAAALMREVQSLLAAPAASLQQRSDAIERAITACDAALELLGTGERGARGTVYFNRGICWRARVEGDPADNAEQAIESFTRALELRDRDDEPEEWARTQNALGVAWSERRRGDPAANGQAALAALGSALEVRREFGDGDDIAGTLANLANLRLKVGGVERSENIERAVAEYREALALLDPDNSETRAPVLFNLATALLERAGGDRAENIEQAIEALERSLALGPDAREEHAAKLALANALGLRVRGEKAENLDSAIALVDEVVAYREQHETAERQAAAHNSRGVLYGRRIRGARAENIEQAIISDRRALDVYTAEVYPADRAGSLNNLSTALRARLLGDRRHNEDEAIGALREALQTYTREADPYSWAGTMSNLGTALFERQTGDRNDNIDGAISAYRAALEVRQEHELPWEWAATQFNLGQALWRKHRGNRIANLTAAEEALEATLRVRRRDETPDEWAATQSMLGVIRDELAELTSGGAERAITAYENALTIYTPTAFPSEARANANNLAGLLLRTDDPARAFAVARTGLLAAEMLYGAAPTEEGREQELEDNARLYRLAAEAALAARRPDREAFEIGEAGRGRLLAERLGIGPLPAPPSIDPALIDRETAAYERLRTATGQARRSSDQEIKEARMLSGTAATERLAPSSLRLLSQRREFAANAAASARGSLEEIWGQIATEPAGREYVEQRRGARVSANELQAWLDAQPGRPAIVIFSALHDRPVAFVAARGGHGPEAVRYSVTHVDVDAHLEALEHEVLAASVPARKETWTEIGELLMAPALAALGDEVTLLYVVPLGRLHVVPWHASTVGGAALIERFPLVYAASTAAAVRLARPDSPAPRPGDGAAVIGDPGANLKYARREAETVAQQLAVAPLLGVAATVEASLAALTGIRWAHLAAHGHYDPADPLASGVMMADGVLRAGELIDRRAPGVMVVSTCESGRQLANPGDELWGLARALLYAGTTTAVLSLWRVADRVGERLMLRFYDALRDSPDAGGPVIANALRAAMLATRAEHPSSFLWAPFTLLGNPY